MNDLVSIVEQKQFRRLNACRHHKILLQWNTPWHKESPLKTSLKHGVLCGGGHTTGLEMRSNTFKYQKKENISPLSLDIVFPSPVCFSHNDSQ